MWLLYLPELLRWQLGPSRSARTDYAALDRRYPLERGTAGLWCLGEIGLFTELWSGLGWLPAAGMGQPTLFLGGFVLVHVAGCG